ncbi:MAG: carboxypeptidase-like regulatory domain-containing protein [Flavobacterium sp. JAD_PAG50586_2]|nr:MAG: carboxypeptidase-like regulatory domain-containing protein [Flavobacterium sp. JAD_PAG50586_2]
MMRKVLIILFLFAIASAQSQIIIKGRVTDKDNVAIDNASITLEDTSDDSVTEFAITDEKGNYKLETENANAKLRIVVSSMNHKEIRQEIVFKSQTLDFILREEATQLQEVKIDFKAIQQKADTLSFSVAAFEGKEDRTLSDVLKKIPGIEVDPSGQIKYQGNAINKFYVEGKDLMAGGYGTLTNSMPKDAVTKVQVLENHQPIKAIRKNVPSDKAAINIKLKKDITLTGRADLGAGFSPFLWSAKITPMVFTKKYQYLLNYKSNNTGENVTEELQVFSFDGGFEGFTMDNQTGSWLNTDQAALPKISENRYLFNKTQLFSANLLTSLSKDWEIKTNVNFFNDNISRNGSQFTRVNFFDDNGNITNYAEYSRDNSTSQNNNHLLSQLILTKNSDKSFLKDTFTYKGNWNKAFGPALLNSDVVNQYLSSPGFSFQNSLSAITLLGKKVVNIKSTLNYINDRQTYGVSPYENIDIAELPNNNAERMKQDVFNTTLNLNNELSFIFSIKKFSIIPTLGFEVEKKKLATSLFGYDATDDRIEFGDDFNNNLSWKKLVPFSGFAVNYIDDSFSLNVNLPVRYNLMRVEDAAIDFEKKLDRFTFEPAFTAKYKFTTELSKTLYGSISNGFGDISSVYPSYIFSALNLTRQNSDIQQSMIKRIGGNLEYKLILYNLFLNLNYELSQNKASNIVSQNVSQNGQTVFEQLPIENLSNTKSVNVEISKYIPIAKSKVALGYGVTSNDSNLILNSVSRTVSLFGNRINFKMNSNYFSWLTLDCNLNYSVNRMIGSNPTEVFNSDIKVLFYPAENQSIGIYREDYVYNFNSQRFKNQFLDLSYQYTLEKRKIDIELKWTNILNTKNYQEILLNSFGYTSNIFTIRPSQVLVSVRFNFN